MNTGLIQEMSICKNTNDTANQIVTWILKGLVLLIMLAHMRSSNGMVTMNKRMQRFAGRTTNSWWVFATSGAGMFIRSPDLSLNQQS